MPAQQIKFGKKELKKFSEKHIHKKITNWIGKAMTGGLKNLTKQASETGS